jgi:O-acetyl-ADP-ribose deacetylase (regulator of RNase III)
MKDHLEVLQADITTLRFDAIVNAANARLLHGGGVDGAIRRAAGSEINEDLERIGYCAPGSSVLTFGYRLPASYVIHTVAPVWQGIGDDEERLLASCYSSALKLADENDIRSIAFPAIGTGAYGWPAERAAELAFAAVTTHLTAGGRQDRVIFCCFNADDAARYERLIAANSRRSPS